MEKPIKPAKLPNNYTSKLMWGALAVIVFSVISVKISDRISPSQQSELTMLPIIAEPIPNNQLCKVGINSASFRESCGTGLYRYIDYQCHGWNATTMGSTSSCKDTNTWMSYAQNDCNSKGNPTCNATPSPMPPYPTTPTPISTPYVCLAPGQYCLNSNIKCCSGVCDSKGYCNSGLSTPYPTPTSCLPNGQYCLNSNIRCCSGVCDSKGYCNSGIATPYPIKPTATPVNTKVSACQTLYKMYCLTTYDNYVCPLVKQACVGIL